MAKKEIAAHTHEARELQEMLDAVCFEPGLFQPDAPRPPPAQVPAASRDVFATPVGLLVNELQHAPASLLASLLELGRNALELDIGRFRNTGGSLALLYALRLLVRVEGHVTLVLAGPHYHGGAGDARGTAPASAAALMVALLAHITGMFVERWLFFAEAKHVVTLYYEGAA